MLRFQEGDKGAFRILFERYNKKIVNYCYRFVGDQGVAEELAQEVFVRVYKASGRYRPQARFSTWIFRIATNLCLNEKRKPVYSVWTDSLDRFSGEEAEGGPREVADRKQLQALEQIESREEERVIQRAMGELPDNQRAALLLRIDHGFSYREIAEQLGCSENNVKILIHRGRQHLKQAFEDYRQGDT